MKIVLIGQKTIGDDIDLSPFRKLGEFVAYDYAGEQEVPSLVRDADVVIVNKTPINARTLAGADGVKLVCVTATGTNNLDKEYLDAHGIAWRNVAGYSTESVAQLTFALFFYLWEHLPYYDEYVKSGRYVEDRQFTHFARTFREMDGKRWGIIGLGAIGRRVGELARGFGMRVQYCSTSGVERDEPYPRVPLEELLETSDVVSVHCPLTETTEGLIDAKALARMRSDAILLNLSRGPVVDEAALADALERGEIAGAGLDVLTVEPMAADNPLRRITDSNRLIITPHIGWAGKETRERLMEIVYTQIKTFFESTP